MDFWCYIKSWLIFSGDLVASLTGIKKLILVAFLKIVNLSSSMVVSDLTQLLLCS